MKVVKVSSGTKGSEVVGVRIGPTTEENDNDNDSLSGEVLKPEQTAANIRPTKECARAVQQ